MKIATCNENWNDMTPNSKGRYCEICQLSVLNLNDKSMEDIEILKEENGKICGRVSKIQVAEFQYLHPLKRFAIALFLVFGTSLFTMSYSQILNESIQLEELENSYKIDFKAVNKNGDPLSGVFVNFDTNDDYKEGSTDDNGNLSLSFSNASNSVEIYVNISYKDIYGTVVYKAESAKTNRFDRIVYDESTFTLQVGSQTFHEEFIMGDIAPVEWQEDPFEQKTQDN